RYAARPAAACNVGRVYARRIGSRSRSGRACRTCAHAGAGTADHRRTVGGRSPSDRMGRGTCHRRWRGDSPVGRRERGAPAAGRSFGLVIRFGDLLWFRMNSRFAKLACAAALVMIAARASAQAVPGYTTTSNKQERIGPDHLKYTGFVELEQGDTKLYADEV